MSEKAKHYSKREEIISSSLHLTAAVLALGSIIPLWRTAEKVGSGLFYGCVIFYWIALLSMFGASGFYHICPWKKFKPVARKFDHCAIYLLITGTYAPLLSGAVKSTSGNIVLASLILLTIIGISGKWLFANRFHRLEVIIYIIMGWACVFIAGELIDAMSRPGLLYLLYGGIAYTGGVAFYVCRKEFCHAVWHLFVLAGAVLQFFAILSIGNI